VHGSTGVIGYTETPEYSGDAILVARVGANAGKLKVSSGRYGVTDNTIQIRIGTGASLHFLYRQLEAKQLNKFVFGSGQPLITGSLLKSLPLAIPSLDEQRGIVAALSDVDALLSELDRLIAKKHDLKKAAMQQLLSGRTRLPGFNGEWKGKRLGDLGKCLRGVSYRGDVDLFTHDAVHTKKLLRANNVQDAIVLTEDAQIVNSDRVAEYQILRQNDVLICMANGSKTLVGKAGLFQVNDGYDYTFGAFMGCFRTHSAEASPGFVFCLFQTERYRDHINNLLAGSTINNLSPKAIESLEFPMPPIREQVAIAAVISDMCAELAGLEARRDKTRALKQAMTQDLLTGRIRLV
jgi:type I restriction enzyme, S subunit